MSLSNFVPMLLDLGLGFEIVTPDLPPYGLWGQDYS